MSRIITISRQFGSGGRLIALKTAEMLNIPCYDKEVIDLVAQKSGFHADFIKENEQKISTSFLYSLAVGQHYSNGGVGLPLTDQLYIVEKEVIESVAKEGPCVIVGRCADYILKGKYDLFSVFICGDYEQRIKRIEEVYGLSEEASVSKIKKYDKARANHYNHFTECKWGKCDNYDMIINTSTFGIDKTAEIIASMYKSL